MKLNYILLFFAFFLCTLKMPAQTEKPTEKQVAPSETAIEGLSVFPNPITNGKVYINSKFNLKKDIEIFDVLGKKVISTSQMRRELDVSNLMAGVYVLKIAEGNKTATRKLVIR